MFDTEEPTLELNKSTILARESAGDLVLELARLPGGDLLLDVVCNGEVISITRHRNLTDFQAGRLLEHEVLAYRKVVR